MKQPARVPLFLLAERFITGDYIRRDFLRRRQMNFTVMVCLEQQK